MINKYCLQCLLVVLVSGLLTLFIFDKFNTKSVNNNNCRIVEKVPNSLLDQKFGNLTEILTGHSVPRVEKSPEMIKMNFISHSCGITMIKENCQGYLMQKSF